MNYPDWLPDPNSLCVAGYCAKHRSCLDESVVRKVVQKETVAIYKETGGQHGIYTQVNNSSQSI
jgi:hypothetical protein